MPRVLALGLMAAFLCALAPAPARAQDNDMQEIIVTASRISNGRAGLPDFVPVVKLRRNADFVFVTATIESDSLDAALRATEVRNTLAALVRAAEADPKIELSIRKTLETEEGGVEYLVDFSTEALGFVPGYRPNTTRVSFIMKTPIAQDETDVEAVTERFDDFIDAIDADGRANVSHDDEFGLSVVDLAQYRAVLLQQLARDAAALRKQFPGAEVQLAGFEFPVSWRAAGPIQLDIYFPYSLSITQK
jgi:hypothetical protein